MAGNWKEKKDWDSTNKLMPGTTEDADAWLRACVGVAEACGVPATVLAARAVQRSRASVAEFARMVALHDLRLDVSWPRDRAKDAILED
jgi:hypothetical protein